MDQGGQWSRGRKGRGEREAVDSPGHGKTKVGCKAIGDDREGREVLRGWQGQGA